MLCGRPCRASGRRICAVSASGIRPAPRKMQTGTAQMSGCVPAGAGARHVVPLTEHAIPLEVSANVLAKAARPIASWDGKIYAFARAASRFAALAPAHVQSLRPLCGTAICTRFTFKLVFAQMASTIFKATLSFRGRTRYRRWNR